MTLNPYSVADVSAKPQNEMEARALVRTASRLNTLKENWPPKREKLDEALELNRKLWTFFLSEICDERNPLPREIKQNIFNLAHFIFKHTFAIQANPKAESLDILININMNIARGLNEQSKLRKEQTATPSTSQNA